MSKVLKNHKLFYLGVFIAFLVAVSDLFTKKLIFSILETYPNQQIEVFSFFNLVKVLNNGVSFGMFNQLEHGKIIFSFIQLSIAFILFFWLYNNQKIHFTYALAFIIGGALGNAIDRIQNGAVADFLDFYISSYHWPAFNLADSFVFIGVVILLLDDLFFKKK
jgi:signal peptidase II